MFYSYLTWPYLKKNIKKMKVLLPLGSVEQHAYHLPVATDALIAETLALLLSKKKKILVLPTIHYSISPEHSDFPGTIVINEKTLLQCLSQIYNSLHPFGLKELTILNCHGGNHKALEKLGKGFKVINIWRLIPHNHFEHAGELETSLALALMPSNVKLDKVTKGTFLEKKIKNIKVADYSKTGVMGDATKASKAKGRKLLSALLKKLQKLI